MTCDECRAELFRERGHEVLGSVVQGTQISQPDPFDVDEIHPEAREAFGLALRQVRAGPVSKILLIRGEAGCGKTHLIRSLRTRTHGLRQGIIAYVHMTAEQGDYRQYLLRQVVRSLSDPFMPADGTSQSPSALDLISDALVQREGFDVDLVEQLREADGDALAGLVDSLADRLSDDVEQFSGVDLNTLRVLLYRQSTQKPIRRRVAAFLNGEPLSQMDWEKLKALPPDCDRGPLYLLGQLARVTLAATGMPLIVCVDQIEASDITGKNHDPFIRAMGTACELIENVPGALVVLSCLDSAYNVHAPHLIQAYRHRIENDPPPVLLAAARIAGEVRQILSRRLKYLYESEGLTHVPPESVFPLPEDLPERLAGQHVRTILQAAHAYWSRCAKSMVGTLPAWSDAVEKSIQEVGDGADVDRVRVAWNEFCVAGGNAVGEDDHAQMDLLKWALEAIGPDLEEGTTIRVGPATARDGGTLPPCLDVAVRRPRTRERRCLVGLCDKDPRGGGLERQIKALESARTDPDQAIVVIRSMRFPKGGKTAERLAAMQRQGDATAVVEDGAWQTMQAMRRFLSSRASEFGAASIAEWRRSDLPLASLPGISVILRGGNVGGEVTDALPASTARTAPPNKSLERSSMVAPPRAQADTGLVQKPAPADAARAAEPPPREVVFAARSPLAIGRTDSFSPAEVELDPQILTRHTAILGANGSGKTVLALSILEMLLERGISAILFDRKGDLATYAVEEAWRQQTGAPDEASRRARLREQVDVHLYTPGSATGRPLVLPLLPEGLDQLAEQEREEQVRQAAWILTDVCQPPKAKADLFATVLAKAIHLLCGGNNSRGLDELEEVLLQAPYELLQLLPAHEPKDCVAVGRRLNERRVAHGRLFSDQGEKLDLPTMLNGANGGRVRLNIISTQSLDADSGLIWIAQFLAAAGQFILRHPSEGGRLQAVLMFDEADLYIPANRKPATKPGMENLLRRARAAGVGIMLVSQNVGDFDYKALDNITTVFAGKLTTPRAMEKLRSRFGSSTDRLSRKTSGQFLMGIENEIREVRSHMCLLRPTPVPGDQIERLAAEQALKGSPRRHEGENR